MPFGTLYLLPVPIGETPINRVIPEFNNELIKGLKYFIAEDAKTARRFLKLFGYDPISNAIIEELNEHNQKSNLLELIQPLLSGNDIGLMSDAGCPGIADPGAEVVRLAHQKNIKVVPLIGPSSIVLSIMASGFNGQNFAFVGYLPIDKPLRVKRLRELESDSQKQNQAQFFIETPYRNTQLFDDAISTLNPQTKLFVGVNMSTTNEMVKVKTIVEWKKSPKPDFQKIPTVFGIY